MTTVHSVSTVIRAQVEVSVLDSRMQHRIFLLTPEEAVAVRDALIRAYPIEPVTSGEASE